MPKTIDNDLSATDYTFGFDTAVNIAMSAIDRLHTTAESHKRTLICEVMGTARRLDRVPRRSLGRSQRDPDPRDRVRSRPGLRLHRSSLREPLFADRRGGRGGRSQGRDAIADGAPTDSFGHVRLGGIAHWLEGEIEQRTGHEARATVLGHVQRGGTPTAFDRVLATRFGLHAIDAAHGGQWGKMTALRSTDIELVDLTEATAELKTVPESLYREAEVFFG